MVVQHFLGYVNGAVFALFEGAAYIFADDADAEQLHGGKEQNQHNDGGIAGDINALDQLFQQNPDEVEHGAHPGEAAQHRGQPQGGGGVADDALDGVLHQLPEAPLGGSGGPLTGGVGDEAGVIAYPGENALGEAVVFPQLQNAVPDTAAEGAEVAGIRLQGHVGELVDDGIKAALEEREHLSLTAAVLVGGHHIVLRLLVQNLHHVPDNLWPLLQVGIDQTDVLAVGVFQSGVNAGFLAEIPGEGHHLHRAGLDGVEFFQIVQRGILAAVVDIDQFIVIATAVKGGHHCLLKGGYIFRLVIAGNY